MPVIFALLATVFVALIIGTVFFTIAGFIFFMWLDIIIIALLVYYKQYLVLLIGIPLVTLIRSIQYRKQDLCAEICENFVKNYCQYVENEDDIKQAREYELPADKPIEQDSSTTRQYAYVITRTPHVCHNQKTICYSQSGKYKVTIQHTGWNNYLFFLTNYFTITREEVPQEQQAHITRVTPHVVTNQEQEEDIGLLPKVVLYAVLTVIYGFSFIVYCWLDIVIVAFFLFQKLYLVPLIGISLITLIRTIQYRNVDIFAEACEGFVAQERDSIQDTEESTLVVEHLKKNGNRHTMPKQCGNRAYAYVIPLKPHTCHNQSTTFYSPDQTYKRTIQHSVWYQWLIYQHNTFIITDEVMNDNGENK